ncbi:unnamed protein product [Paramecium octaurelia]|uniref:Uncharacterized protein n=1 Tax=Paramecium octaurelia TaxID=43137 RepID=A0A8S1W2E3_PAROT|nr:unnamed protein product [Paramecium octaurelia]
MDVFNFIAQQYAYFSVSSLPIATQSVHQVLSEQHQSLQNKQPLFGVFGSLYSNLLQSMEFLAETTYSHKIQSEQLEVLKVEWYEHCLLFMSLYQLHHVNLVVFDVGLSEDVLSIGIFEQSLVEIQELLMKQHLLVFVLPFNHKCNCYNYYLPINNCKQNWNRLQQPYNRLFSQHYQPLMPHNQNIEFGQCKESLRLRIDILNDNYSNPDVLQLNGAVIHSVTFQSISQEIWTSLGCSNEFITCSIFRCASNSIRDATIQEIETLLISESRLSVINTLLNFALRITTLFPINVLHYY